jgi:hypothetical protein
MVDFLQGTKKFDILSTAMIFTFSLILKSLTTVVLADLLSMDNFCLGTLMMQEIL